VIEQAEQRHADEGCGGVDTQGGLDGLR